MTSARVEATRSFTRSQPPARPIALEGFEGLQGGVCNGQAGACSRSHTRLTVLLILAGCFYQNLDRGVDKLREG
jgi:hypothetical protein